VAAKSRRRVRKPEPAAAQTQRNTLGAQVDLGTAMSVVIRDAWTGRDTDSPIVASLHLRRMESGVLAGVAYLFKHGAMNRSEEITLNSEVASAFLRRLSNAALSVGRDRSFVERNNDFPRIEIAIHLGSEPQADGIVMLYSVSEEAFHAPWSAWVRGDVYAIAGDEVGRAVQVIRDLVQREPTDVAIKAHAKRLVDRLDEKFRPTRKPGEAMSRDEAEAWGGPEFGGMIYRLANSSDNPKATRSRSRSRKG
jgi:hypothetical protein